MNVTEITVHASRTLPHPVEQFANIRPSVTLKADLSDGDDTAECVKQLQRNAELLVEEHAVLLRSSLQERDVMEREANEITSLSDNIHRQTQRLEELKERRDERQAPAWLEWGNTSEDDQKGEQL